MVKQAKDGSHQGHGLKENKRNENSLNCVLASVTSQSILQKYMQKPGMRT